MFDTHYRFVHAIVDSIYLKFILQHSSSFI